MVGHMTPKPKRPRHPKKDLEKNLREIENGGWTVTKWPGGYFKLKCPCGDHLKTMPISPSNPNKGKETVRWCRRTCWRETNG